MHLRFGRLLCLLLVVCLCVGCDNTVTTRTVTCDSLSMSIPKHFQDWVLLGYYSDVNFAYGYMERLVVGEKIPFSEFDGWVPSAKEYAKEFAYGNNLSTPVEERDGLITIYYEVLDTETNILWGWLASFYTSSDSVWIVQCSCPADVFSEKELDFRNYLHSVTFNEQ